MQEEHAMFTRNLVKGLMVFVASATWLSCGDPDDAVSENDDDLIGVLKKRRTSARTRNPVVHLGHHGGFAKKSMSNT